VRFALIPSSIADAISASGSKWGTIDLRVDNAEDIVIVDGYSEAQRVKRRPSTPWLQSHYSRYAPRQTDSGFWYRTDPELHLLGRETARRGGGLFLDLFREHIPTLRTPDRDGWRFVLTVARTGDGATEFGAWAVASSGAVWFPHEVVVEDADLYEPLDPGWPRESLEDKLVTIVGAGSIGSAAAEALAAFAVRTLALVDPDRLESRNFARHRVSPKEIGRYKVNALADLLQARDPELKIERFPLDVIDDADAMRPLFRRSACVLVCTDGVASRRSANHLARRAGVPAVFACVLDDGAIGEIIRVVPGRTACLLCSREELTRRGALDPEPTLDRGYGTGSRHLPMTAVGGDLDLVGRLAARVVVSTLLEAEGYLPHRIPGDHAIVGLRASPEPLKAPFDVARVGQVAWHDLPRPAPDCPSCTR
jgi:molybdopterin/thiamine biosynthesis adenylyltransferase